MGVALFPVLEREIPGIDAASVSGKALSRAEPELRKIAISLGVTPLMEFYGADDAALAEGVLDGEGLDFGEWVAPAAKWFAAGEGLGTVSGLLRYVEEHPGSVAEAEGVVADLRAMQGALAEAEKAGVRWHLAVDF